MSWGAHETGHAFGPSLSAPGTPSAIEVPAGDAPDHYYALEYRKPTLGYASGTAWGQKLPGPGVVIHEVRTDGLSYLVDQQGGSTSGLAACLAARRPRTGRYAS